MRSDTLPLKQELEDTILGAEDRSFMLWNMTSFATIRNTVAGEVLRIQKTARAIALLDVMASLSIVSQHNIMCAQSLIIKVIFP